MKIISLTSLIEAAHDEKDVQDYLSIFSCNVNKDVESFLRKKAIESEKRDITRTSLVIDEYNTNEIIGYFSLMIKSFNFASDVSVSSKKRLTGNKSSDNFVTILIAQLGRSDNYKGLFSGQEVLMQALNNCLYIKELCGLKIVCVEYDDISNLNDFYIGNEFRILQVNPSRKILAYLRL